MVQRRRVGEKAGHTNFAIHPYHRNQRHGALGGGLRSAPGCAGTKQRESSSETIPTANTAIVQPYARL